MHADHENLLQLAARPLEGNSELHVAALGDLESRLGGNSESTTSITTAIAAFQRADQRGPLARHWRMLVYLTALALMVYGATKIPRLRAMAAQLSSLTSFGPTSAASSPKRPSHLTSQQRLLLYGDDRALNLTDRWKPLWDRDSSNPVFFAQYVHGVFSDNKSLTPELLAEAARIDPGNAWYPAIQAGALLDGAVVREKQNSSDRLALKAATYTVKNQEKLADAIELIHQAAAMERLNSRQEELIKLQIPLLGERTDWISQVSISAFLAGNTASGSIAMRRLSDAFAAEADRLANEGKRDEFLRLVESMDQINRKFLDGAWSFVDLLVAKMVMTSPAPNFRDAALKLGLEKEAGQFEALAKWSRDDREMRNRKRRPDPTECLIDRRAALLAAYSLPLIARQAENPPPVSKNDLLPSRLAEHALSQRILAMLSCVILVIASGLASIRFLGSSKLNRKLSARLTDLLKRRDWLLILLGGAVSPIMCYLALIYLSPLSGREWSLRLLGFIPLFAHSAAALVLVLTLTTALASHVLDRRLAVFGLSATWPKTRWAMVVCASLSVLTIGAVAPAFYEFNLTSPARHMLLWGGCSLIAVPLLWLIGGLVKPLIGFGGIPLRFATLHRLLVPAWAVAFITLAITVLLHAAIERHWMQKDKLLGITTEAPSCSRYEWEVTQQLRRELKEKLKMLSP